MSSALVPLGPAGPPDRIVKDVPFPIWDYLPRDKLYNNDAGRTINLENLRNHLLREGRLSPQDAIDLINRAASIFRREPNLLTLQDPITVAGDVHGQMYDLVKLFEVGGDPMSSQYLFLGDYVDRGYFGTEVTLYLLAIKINRPDGFFMLRGNHECRHLTAYFNFKNECKYKYNMSVYDTFMNCFDCLPLAAVLNGRFLCVHGGLSPDVTALDDIRAIHRFREPPPSGPMCDLLWSDPMEDEDDDGTEAKFVHNELRGCSYVYSYQAVCQFLQANKLLGIIRAHEAQDEGYRLYRKCEATEFPSVICIFSAPNYCDVYNNKGAIIRFQNNLMNIRQFNSSPHPYFLPNFMNAFTWSAPFVAEKITEMLFHILNVVEDSPDDDDEPEEEEGPSDIEERADAIKAKIRAIGKVCRMFKTLREENESILFLKGLAGGVLPQGLLSRGPAAVREAVEDFKRAKEIDALNEKRPPMSMLSDGSASNNPPHMMTVHRIPTARVTSGGVVGLSHSAGVVKMDGLVEEAERKLQGIDFRK